MFMMRRRMKRKRYHAIPKSVRFRAGWSTGDTRRKRRLAADRQNAATWRLGSSERPVSDETRSRTNLPPHDQTRRSPISGSGGKQTDTLVSDKNRQVHADFTREVILMILLRLYVRIGADTCSVTIRYVPSPFKLKLHWYIRKNTIFNYVFLSLLLCSEMCGQFYLFCSFELL